MLEITSNEMHFILLLLKSPEVAYNAHKIAKQLNITPMGTLKIAKRLEKEEILTSKELGRARFYHLNSAREYVARYASFLLRREAEQAHPSIRRWIREVKKIEHADVAILYGSLLRKHNEARDIDLLVITDAKRYKKLADEIDAINKINTKKLHPLYQTKNDLRMNIQKNDKPLLQAIKGIVVFGEDILVRLLT